ncbi:hypothetical protein MAR_000622 [Mya arenaria]|uniref:Uncharacterized protein n=1 Tax=Mya arenaria TaxID=6604 RepID=A0ABY7FD87_MYAAR|nr:uncharacterized protein LOC128207445 [Mya arenaria]WAR18784.1 hypothetical protein MAR_000622 [Mya arenaria]
MDTLFLVALTACVVLMRGGYADEPFCSGNFAGQLLNLEKSLSDVTDRLKHVEYTYNRHANLLSHPPSSITTLLRAADLEKGGWRLVFRATSGNGQNVHDAWLTGAGTTDTKPDDMSRTYSNHFRVADVENVWKAMAPRYAKVGLYRDNREVAYVVFDAKDSDLKSWFAKDRVLDASWSDLTASGFYNVFSVDGSVSKYYTRTFLINSAYGGCPKDLGHLAVVEKMGSCEWDTHPAYPQFLYADLNHSDLWEKQRFGRADFFAIFASA